MMIVSSSVLEEGFECSRYCCCYVALYLLFVVYLLSHDVEEVEVAEEEEDEVGVSGKGMLTRNGFRSKKEKQQQQQQHLNRLLEQQHIRKGVNGGGRALFSKKNCLSRWWTKNLVDNAAEPVQLMEQDLQVLELWMQEEQQQQASCDKNSAGGVWDTDGNSLYDDPYWLGVLGSAIGFRCFRGDPHPVVSLHEDFCGRLMMPLGGGGGGSGGTTTTTVVGESGIPHLVAWALVFPCRHCCKDEIYEEGEEEDTISSSRCYSYPPRKVLERIVKCFLESLAYLLLPNNDVNAEITTNNSNRCCDIQMNNGKYPSINGDSNNSSRHSISVTLVDLLLEEILLKETEPAYFQTIGGISSRNRTNLRDHVLPLLARRLRRDLIMLRVFEVCGRSGRVHLVSTPSSCSYRNYEKAAAGAGTAIQKWRDGASADGGSDDDPSGGFATCSHLVDFCIRNRYFYDAVRLMMIRGSPLPHHHHHPRCLAEDRLRRMGAERAVESWFRDIERIDRATKQQYLASGLPDNWRSRCYERMASSLLNSATKTYGDGDERNSKASVIAALHRLATCMLQIDQDRNEVALQCFEKLYEMIPTRLEQACLDACLNFQRLGDVSSQRLDRNRACQCREACTLLRQQPDVQTLHTVVVKALSPTFFLLQTNEDVNNNEVNYEDTSAFVDAFDELRQQVALVARLCRYLAETVFFRVRGKASISPETRNGESEGGRTMKAKSFAEELMSLSIGFKQALGDDGRF